MKEVTDMMNEMKNMMDNELENISGGTAEGTLYHHVVTGDTLGKIAAKYGTTVKKLMALNPHIKNANLIYAGDYIRVR